VRRLLLPAAPRLLSLSDRGARGCAALTRGTVYTCTVIHQAAPGFDVPYALGYVDLPEGVRVLGQIAGVEPEAVRIGMEVEVSFEPFGEDDLGQELIGYRFHPAPAER
jgi:uncharacterized OB-fold protein